MRPGLARGDWLRIALVVLGSALIGLAFFLVIDGAQARRDLLTQALDVREAQSRRIDGLQVELERLAQSEAERGIAISALVEQLRREGLMPIVVVPPTGPGQLQGAERPLLEGTPRPSQGAGPRRSGPSRSSSPRPRPQPSSSPTPRPSPRPSQTASPTPRPCPVPDLPVVGCPVPRRIS